MQETWGCSALSEQKEEKNGKQVYKWARDSVCTATEEWDLNIMEVFMKLWVLTIFSNMNNGILQYKIKLYWNFYAVIPQRPKHGSLSPFSASSWHTCQNHPHLGQHPWFGGVHTDQAGPPEDSGFPSQAHLQSIQWLGRQANQTPKR